MRKMVWIVCLLVFALPVLALAQDGTPEAEMAVEPIVLPEVDALAVTGDVVAAGSSTVYPVTERMADRFVDAGFSGTITVDSIGTGAGFERFCAGETDISNASRAIRPDEVDTCAANGIEALEFYVAIDALAVTVSSSNDFVENLTLEQLAQIFTLGSSGTWADIDPSWPAEPIQLFSPGTDSGTFDYFVEVIFDSNEEPILNAPGVQLSEDDNVLVQGVESSPYAIGYFGYAYYIPNADRLRALNVEGVEPNEGTAESGEYPLSRPLYIYSSAAILTEKPQVAAFINFYLGDVNDELGTEEGQIGYFPVSVEAMNANKQLWLDTSGGGM